MKYIIFVTQDDQEVMHSAPVPDEDAAYLCDAIVPTLRPLSDEDYMQGPAVILRTLARFSYILSGSDVCWCAEWDPGLIVVRFSPDGTLAWTAIRSPNPEFGGRKATQEDLDAFDEDAENHQYNLVFDAWDAQFDEDDRRWRNFTPVDAATSQAFEAALAHVYALGEIKESRHANDSSASFETCKKNIEAWAGEGIRLE